MLCIMQTSPVRNAFQAAGFQAARPADLGFKRFGLRGGRIQPQDATAKAHESGPGVSQCSKLFELEAAYGDGRRQRRRA